MQRQLRRAIGCVAEVPPLFHALIDGNAAKREGHKDKRFELEPAADGLNNDPCDHLRREPADAGGPV